MAIKIYNTLNRKKEEFVPLEEGKVGIYVCGPTVYGHPHIGHAKSYISFDLIVRYFKFLEYKVKYVQNITDVGHLTDDADEGEDKIIKKAREDKLDPVEISEYYTWSYFDDMNLLNVQRPNITPKATGHIIEQIQVITQLLEKEYAYEINGNVYFNVSKFKDYGKLSGRKLDELKAGSRIEINNEKRSPFDFALWKKAEKGHIMKWPSPWGEGYPGWHLECSAMSMKYLGETFDIHGGGLENQFPHHECEIAQSEAATGKPFVRYWIHNNMVTVEGQKMGKSLGNFINLKEVFKKYNPLVIRFFILTSHYRSTLDFSDKALIAAQTGFKKLTKFFNQVKKIVDDRQNKSGTIKINVDNYYKKVKEAMDDDFNSPRVIATLFDLSKEVNQIIQSDAYSLENMIEINSFIENVADKILGIVSIEPVIEDEKVQNKEEELISLLIGLRKNVRDEKNFALADKIRDDLLSIGVQLKDTPDGTTYEYVSVEK